MLGSIEPVVYRHLKTYDLIVYCPIPKQNELLDDGFRLTEEEYQGEISDIRTSSDAV